jgi:hypothetical protein
MRRLRDDLCVNPNQPEFKGIDKAIEEETGDDSDKVAQGYTSDQLLILVREILEKRRKGKPEPLAYG